MTKDYNKPQENNPFATPIDKLPIDRPVAVYYRQSTEGQIGNISTSMQTVDMISYLTNYGWNQNNVILIDMDGGVSGTTKIDEREGMSYLFDLITDRKIGAVACQDEDRLFRDITQIQVNIFIEACRANNVTVITPTMIYQFANPTYYTFHARQFRFKSEMAAEYLNTVIRGKLHGAKLSMMRKGQWTGGTVPVGYIIDKRKTLPDGSSNTRWRKYTIFEPYAEVIREYFDLFLYFGGNLRRTARHIHEQGPYYPDPAKTILPVGFDTRYTINWYGNGYCPSYTGLGDMLSNSVYIGHWSLKGVILNTENHVSIITKDVFMKAFNRLSKVDFEGNRNPYFTGAYEHTRPALEEGRDIFPPMFLGLIMSHDGIEWRKTGYEFSKRDKNYRYVFRNNDQYGGLIWSRSSRHVDKTLQKLLLQKLSATFDADVWSQTLQKSTKQFGKERKRIQKQLQILDTTIQNQISNLDRVTHPDLIHALQERYASALTERERLNGELTEMKNEEARLINIRELQQNWGVVLDQWDELDYHHKRNVVDAFIKRIELTPTERKGSIITIYWRDDSNDTIRKRAFTAKGKKWLIEEIELIHKMFEDGVTQLNIAIQFPERQWDKIFGIIRDKYGDDAHQFEYQIIRWQETFNQFKKRYGSDKPLPLRSSGLSWQEYEDHKLRELIEANANRTEVAKNFPYRVWRSIRERIAMIIGTGIKIEGKGKKTVMLQETYMEFLVRTGEIDENSLPTLDDLLSEVQSR